MLSGHLGDIALLATIPLLVFAILTKHYGLPRLLSFSAPRLTHVLRILTQALLGGAADILPKDIILTRYQLGAMLRTNVFRECVARDLRDPGYSLDIPQTALRKIAALCLTREVLDDDAVGIILDYLNLRSVLLSELAASTSLPPDIKRILQAIRAKSPTDQILSVADPEAPPRTPSL